MHTTSFLVDGYAVVLLAVAAGLEALSRHTAARSERFRTAGFTYQAARDLWVCPQDQPLWPHELDRERRLVRYRARPSVCNACPAKHQCTDSDQGRELVRPIDPWPHSEAGRFHRGISVLLTVLACCFLVAGVVAHPGPVELAVGLPLLAASVLLVARWGVDLLRTPSGFPSDPGGRWTGPVRPVDPLLAVGAARQAADRPLLDLVPPSRQLGAGPGGTRWGSQRRVAGARYRRRADDPGGTS